MSAEVGLRVVRGPDWKWGNQDDGEGHLGTVVEIGRHGNPHSPGKTVVVQWDSGSRTNYRAGYHNAFDLRVFDNAPLGTKHPNIVCNSCHRQGIVGMRWKCSRCYDFDLCSECYMSDKHDLCHPFERVETPQSQGVAVPERQGSIKIQARGIFPSAKVVRGHDWDWGNQDGGDGKVGEVVCVRGWEQESGRSVANVTWSSGSINVYRVGHKGKVDLKYRQDATGGFYYRDHLPILGVTPAQHHPTPGSSHSISSTTREQPRFLVGDHVKVLLEVDQLKVLQDGHGGWNPRMADCIGRVGRVHRVTDRGDIRVQYEGQNNRWTFHPDALTKLIIFSVGDMVRVIDDLKRFKELQEGHGEYIETMQMVLGKLGKVIKIYTDGDLRVMVEGHTWTLNPQSVVSVPGSQTELNNTMNANTREEHAHPLLSHFLTAGTSSGNHGTDSQANAGTPAAQTPGGSLTASSQQERLVREAAQGRLEFVIDFLAKYPDRVNHKSCSKTALQVACHQGHAEIVSVLLSAKASVEAQDEEGDTALHYASFGNQPHIIEMLLASGANINAQNRTKCTPLHVAVNKQFVQCVKILLRQRPDVIGGSNCHAALDINIQDSYGDTALHDAISKDNIEITDCLINYPSVDFSLRNRRGFNVLHHAALKGNNFAVEKLVARSRQLVDIKKNDGFAALHLAALNGHYAVVGSLLTLGRCDADIRNNRQQTPLLLAVSEGHESIVELLVSSGADVNVQDEDGDTPLHVALIKRATLRESDTTTTTPSAGDGQVQQATQVNATTPASGNTGEVLSTAMASIQSQLQKLQIDMSRDKGLLMACFLAREGADLHLRNHSNRTPLDLASSQQVVQLLNSFSAHGSIPMAVTTSPVSSATTGTTTPQSHTQVKKNGSSTQVSSQQGPHTAGLCEALVELDLEAEVVSCEICLEVEAVIRLEPCGHVLTCEECSLRLKKCLRCQQIVTAKIHRASGKPISDRSANKQRERPNSLERLRQLESKIQEMEESNCCSICMERRKNIAFLCGHSACSKCAQPLRICHMCRKPITKRIQLYL